MVRHAAERHLKDLVDGPKRGLVWDKAASGRILRFMPAMFTVTAGAKAGHPFVPLPWHMFTAGSLFGWKLESGRLRFRSAWLETGKGQAKSPFMGAIGLYMMGWHGIPRAEVYAIGWEKRTANILFTDAVSMCRAQIPDQDEGDTLESRGEVMIRGVLGNAWKIEHPESGSFFQALANTDANSGPRPACVAADEIHEFKDRSPIDVWRRAIDKQAGDALFLMGTNTPASTQIVGTELSERYQKISKGEYDDDESFAYIARVDEKDREDIFDNEKAWVKSLPALGVTFPIENIRGAVNTVVCSTYHVPPYKVGIGQMPTVSNVQALNLEYYSQALQRLIEDAEECLDAGLGIGYGSNLGTEFDTDNLLRMDSVTQMEVIDKGKNTFTPDEARARINLGPTPGGNVVYRQQQDFSLAALAKRDAQEDPFRKDVATPAIPAPDGSEDEVGDDEARGLIAASLLRKELGLYREAA